MHNNANSQLLEEFDVKIAQNQPTKHLKKCCILKTLIFTVVVIIFCCVAAYNSFNSSGVESHKRNKSRRGLPSNAFPQAPPRPAASNAGYSIRNQK
uniref:Transmembrane protein n=1 Tax=Ditylenchus dipsaci TaxID=166011 RepID=A0A915DNE6_9BILA